jgi:hypothetical protein
LTARSGDAVVRGMSDIYETPASRLETMTSFVKLLSEASDNQLYARTAVRNFMLAQFQSHFGWSDDNFHIAKREELGTQGSAATIKITVTNKTIELMFIVLNQSDETTTTWPIRVADKHVPVNVASKESRDAFFKSLNEPLYHMLTKRVFPR